jgi:hypothetical protein
MNPKAAYVKAVTVLASMNAPAPGPLQAKVKLGKLNLFIEPPLIGRVLAAMEREKGKKGPLALASERRAA